MTNIPRQTGQYGAQDGSLDAHGSAKFEFLSKKRIQKKKESKRRKKLKLRILVMKSPSIALDFPSVAPRCLPRGRRRRRHPRAATASRAWASPRLTIASPSLPPGSTNIIVILARRRRVRKERDGTAYLGSQARGRKAECNEVHTYRVGNQHYLAKGACCLHKCASRIIKCLQLLLDTRWKRLL